MKLPPEINKIVTSNRTPLVETKKMKISVSMQNLVNAAKTDSRKDFFLL